MLIKSSIIVCLLLTFGFTGCGETQPPVAGAPPANASPSPDIKGSANVVKVQSANVTVSAGGNAEATVTLSILSGYHVNANPATFPYLISTEVTAGKLEGITVGKPLYPAGEKRKFQFAPEPLAVYEGDALIKLPLQAAKNVARGTLSLPLSIRVQACDHEQCFPPATLNATVAIEVK